MTDHDKTRDTATRMTAPWILVEDRLPEITDDTDQSDWVLVTVELSHPYQPMRIVEVSQVCIEEEDKPPVWRSLRWEAFDGEGRRIVAWQPFPEPMESPE